MATNVHMKHQNKGKRDFNHAFLRSPGCFGQISESAEIFTHSLHRKTQRVTVHFPPNAMMIIDQTMTPDWSELIGTTHNHALQS